MSKHKEGLALGHPWLSLHLRGSNCFASSARRCLLRCWAWHYDMRWAMWKFWSRKV
ncbi:hypothetical protein [Pontibacter saemangeumensis]|uniref:hypothetical protein n=1 Tax=Pontibacter saemangeumensis TaxID=1084525 RepID=UPI0031F00AFA